MLENEHGILKVPISNGINENFCRVYRKCGRYTFFSLAICVLCFFFLSYTLLDSLNLWMLFIRRFTKRKHCTQKLKYAADTPKREKKFEYTEWHVQLWLFQLQTEIKMFDVKRKCRRHMEWVRREEEKKIVRAPKNNVIISNAYASFLKAKPFICHSTFIP